MSPQPHGHHCAALDKGSGCLGCGCLVVRAVVAAVLFGVLG